MKSLGDRMKKNYENKAQAYLMRRTPVIIRVDGKAFHSFVKKAQFEYPFSESMHQKMMQVATVLLTEIGGAKCAYKQSDEVSVLVTDFDRLNTEAWFNYNVQKLCSISSSLATTTFGLGALFDARCFNIPKEEVVNYFIWRQHDWIRNSLQMLARKYYPHKDLVEKGGSQLHELIWQAGDNWNNLANKWKQGSFLYKDDRAIVEPLDFHFYKERERVLIESLMEPKET